MTHRVAPCLTGPLFAQKGALFILGRPLTTKNVVCFESNGGRRTTDPYALADVFLLAQRIERKLLFT